MFGDLLHGLVLRIDGIELRLALQVYGVRVLSIAINTLLDKLICIRLRSALRLLSRVEQRLCGRRFTTTSTSISLLTLDVSLSPRLAHTGRTGQSTDIRLDTAGS